MSYRVLDEPRPGALARFAVNPLWPLFAIMFGGAWLSWPWFALNGFAVGSPTRRRELGWVLGGFAGGALLIAGVFALAAGGVAGPTAIRYALLVLVLWKLTVSYWLFTLQGRCFELFEHFGGVARNGLGVVILGALLGRRLLGLVDSTFLTLLLR